MGESWLDILVAALHLFVKALHLYYLEVFTWIIPKQPKSLRNEVILITGSANGLGKGICKQLATSGATLILWDISEADNEKTANELRISGCKNVFTDTVDISSRPAILKAIQRLRKNRNIRPVTILVNNAGIAPIQPFFEATPAAIQKTFDINILAHFWLLQEFLPEMITRNKGHIVSICSFFGLNKLRGSPAYTASKHALNGFIESVKEEVYHSYKTNNVKFTTVYPFFINTRMVDEQNSGLKLKFRFPSISPIMEVGWVAERIVEGIVHETEYLHLPSHNRILLFLQQFAPTTVERLFTNYMLEKFEYPNKVVDGNGMNGNYDTKKPIWLANQQNCDDERVIGLEDVLNRKDG